VEADEGDVLGDLFYRNVPTWALRAIAIRVAISAR
jgi:hypothetical protein